MTNITNLINFGNLAETILFFLIIYYILKRIHDKIFQKMNNLNNFEFYLYESLKDYYKDLGYTNFEYESLKKIKDFKKYQKNLNNLDNNNIKIGK